MLGKKIILQCRYSSNLDGTYRYKNYCLSTSDKRNIFLIVSLQDYMLSWLLKLFVSPNMGF